VETVKNNSVSSPVFMVIEEAKHDTRSACYLLHASFLFGLFLDPEDRGDMFQTSVGFQVMLCVMSQEIELCVTTAIGASNSAPCGPSHHEMASLNTAHVGA
jgi:hypothetical protein